MVLSRMAPDPRLVHVIFATHNLDSVLLAVDLMQKLRLEKSKSIHFAQINGMTDQVGFFIHPMVLLTTLKGAFL